MCFTFHFYTKQQTIQIKSDKTTVKMEAEKHISALKMGEKAQYVLTRLLDTDMHQDNTMFNQNWTRPYFVQV